MEFKEQPFFFLLICLNRDATPLNCTILGLSVYTDQSHVVSSECLTAAVLKEGVPSNKGKLFILI